MVKYLPFKKINRGVWSEGQSNSGISTLKSISPTISVSYFTFPPPLRICSVIHSTPGVYPYRKFGEQIGARTKFDRARSIIDIQMVSRATMILLRSSLLPPPLSSLRKSSFSRVLVQQKRFYAVKSSLELPDVQRLAETARISLTPQQVEEFEPKIQQVVEWFGQLQAVDLESIEPALRADTEGDNLRNDAPEIFDNRDAIIAAVPTFEDSYIKVPKVLNKE
ncbi:glutamyl-tRNA(Gln) amidotransferase subunit C, chloroplastic/mitochondrial-like isoform X1 [Primulina eburnea]|uniref:glutamyl-tRNA(Gln) amidotransferase subunit C, chloroplastic/mitochondrial-like isoform X1 n=2 Tax=Primulina eburnea TaxID=1245227 RepID=UPI003C6BF17B